MPAKFYSSSPFTTCILLRITGVFSREALAGMGQAAVPAEMQEWDRLQLLQEQDRLHQRRNTETGQAAAPAGMG